MKLFLKRKSLGDNLELDRGENKIKARRIDKIYKIGACVLGVLWILSLVKPINFKFNIKDLKNIKYMFNEKRGNTLGNDLNSGMAVKYGDYTYYVNFEDDNKIYRVKKGSSVREKVSEDNAHGLSIVGNNLYYINESDEGKIYRLNIKKNEKKKIIDETAGQMQISGRYIYFQKTFKSDMTNGIIQYGLEIDPGRDMYRLYRAKLDGSKVEKVADYYTGRFAVYNGWIYYLNMEDGNQLYRMTRDGTNNTKLVKRNVWDFWMDDKYIYCLNDFGRAGTAAISRIKHDGSEEAEFYNKYVRSMNIVGDAIYFSSDMGVCKMNMEGKEVKSVVPFSNVQYPHVNIVNDYIYYGGVYEGLGRIKTTGKDKEVEPEVPKKIFVKGITGEVDDYYGKTLSMRNNRGIYKYKDYIYYDKMGTHSRINLSTGEKKNIISNGVAGAMDIFGGNIFYINYEDSSKIYMMNEDGEDNKLFFNEKIIEFKISGDYLYYRRNRDGGTGIHRIKLDGSENTKIIEGYLSMAIIFKDNIYYGKNGWLYRSDLDGKNETRILDRGSDNFVMSGDYVYYSFDGIYKMNIKTKETTKISDVVCFPIQIEGDYIYAASFNDGGFFRIKTDGSSTADVTNVLSYPILADGEYVYYNNYIPGGNILSRYNTRNGEVVDMEQGKLN